MERGQEQNYVDTEYHRIMIYHPCVSEHHEEQENCPSGISDNRTKGSGSGNESTGEKEERKT